jgi:hypothetical protein
MNHFLDPSFKDYVSEKYEVSDLSVLNDPAVLQLVYALEWYDIPASSTHELITFHPYLTHGG